MGMGMGMGGGGHELRLRRPQFDPGRVDQTVALGTVEEWTIANTSPMDHPFHLHVWPMQVVAAPDSTPRAARLARRRHRPCPRQVTVRIRFADFAGRTVYHCHILDHEDHGMMGTHRRDTLNQRPGRRSGHTQGRRLAQQSPGSCTCPVWCPYCQNHGAQESSPRQFSRTSWDGYRGDGQHGDRVEPPPPRRALASSPTSSTADR